jgi:hypothetical protein
MTSMTSTTSLFEPVRLGPDGSGEFVATEQARGPWDPQHCHGGPVGALLTRAVESCEPGDTEWHVARVTVELTRPVPIGRPLGLTTATERGGRRVSLVSGVLRDGDTEVARVRGLRVRRADLVLPTGALDVAVPFPSTPDASSPQPFVMAGDGPSFGSSACELRFAEGSWMEPGPVAVWIRLAVPVIPGELPTGAQRAAAAADFGNGVSAVLPWDEFVFINPDLTVHLAHPPRGDWVGLRARTRLAGTGTGLAESEIHDESGVVGRSVQSLYVDRRP